MENNSIKYIVYCTTNTINKKIYIGVHKTNPEIFDNYIGCGVYTNRPSTYERSITKFHYAVKKYGPKNFIRNTIAIFDNEDEAYLLESLIVDEKFILREDVYNMTTGGEGGKSSTTSIRVYRYDEKGNFIEEFSSIHSASLAINQSMASIQIALKNKTKCCNSFWTKIKYDTLDLNKMYNCEGPNKTPVFQYSKTGEYECCYESIRDAARILGIHNSNLGNAIKLGIMCNNKYFTTVFEINYSIAKSTKITSSEIHQYDLDGNYIASYKNMQEAKNKLGIKSNIYQAIKLGRTAGNFQWSFEKFDKITKFQTKSGRSKKVGKYDKDWNFIKEYPSLQKAKEENGVSVAKVVSGERDFCKGFRYKYLN